VTKVRFEELAPREYEEMVSVLLSREWQTHRVDGSGGDGGQDCYFSDDDGTDAYELKSFTGRMTQSRRRQVKRSLARAMEREPRSWTLVAPIDPTPSEQAWFDSLQASVSSRLDWKGWTWLEEKLAQYPDVTRSFSGATEPSTKFEEITDPDRIHTREDFARALNELKRHSGMSIKGVAQRADISSSTVSAYFSGRHLPGTEHALQDILLAAFKIHDLKQHERWLAALRRVRPLPVRHLAELAETAVNVQKKDRIYEGFRFEEELHEGLSYGQKGDQANLLFRVYIPSERLYAAEAQRLLSLFREWLTTARGRGVRQDGYQTASGTMYEFFADASVIQSDQRELFDSFSDFLTLCSEDPSAAADLLVATGLGRASSDDLVAKSGREVHRLQVDLRHERERRMLTIRQNLEQQLLENGLDLRALPTSHINAVIESLVPEPSAPESLMLLAAPWTARPTTSVTVIQNQQIIKAMEGTIIQSIQGTVNLGLQAKEVLTFIERYGGQEAAALESAVLELEDVAAPPAERSAAKHRLKQFLGLIRGTVRDVGVDLLAKYLESKTGL
jgi:transcriptional regulator with XRE-family HTH domain